MKSLAQIFSIDKAILRKQLSHFRVFNWTADPFTLGAYAYSTLGTAEAKKILNRPVENTLFFAGEALGKENESGTVEIALASGQTAARNILSLM